MKLKPAQTPDRPSRVRVFTEPSWKPVSSLQLLRRKHQPSGRQEAPSGQKSLNRRSSRLKPFPLTVALVRPNTFEPEGRRCCRLSTRLWRKEAKKRRTCNNGAGGEEDEVDGNHLGGVEHLHGLVEEPVRSSSRGRHSFSDASAGNGGREGETSTHLIWKAQDATMTTSMT